MLHVLIPPSENESRHPDESQPSKPSSRRLGLHLQSGTGESSGAVTLQASFVGENVQTGGFPEEFGGVRTWQANFTEADSRFTWQIISQDILRFLGGKPYQDRGRGGASQTP